MLRGFRLHKCPYWIRPSITISDQNGNSELSTKFHNFYFFTLLELIYVKELVILKHLLASFHNLAKDTVYDLFLS